MKQEFSDLNDQPSLEDENNFLKMKMMLERGAQFGSISGKCTAEMENKFLKNIMEFERQSDNSTLVKIHKKIGEPSHFKPVAEIPEEEIEISLAELMDWMEKFNISVEVYSPNISRREIYRFITEELFEEEMQDINVPGMINAFIYDEFHPDPIYENTCLATNQCIAEILSPSPFEWWLDVFRQDELQLNNQYPLSRADLLTKVNAFKQSITASDSVEFNETLCMIEENHCFVKGVYIWRAEINKMPVYLEGKWLVEMELDSKSGYWYIFNVKIEGVEI